MKEISILNVIVNKSSSIVRHVFVKPLASDPEKKSVIFVNLPCFCDPESFKKLIVEKFGDVTLITYHSSIEKVGIDESSFDKEKLSPLNGHRVAVVHFKKKASYKELFNFIESEENLYLYGDSKPITGIRRWEKCYNESILDVQSMKEEIATYIAAYDAKVQLEKERAKSMEGVPDEEGWIKVTRHGKKSFLPNSESLDKKITDQMRRKKAKVEGFPYVNKIKHNPF
ncbi:ribosomal RNA-processing protein 7 homolog A [Tetranychus urticae]|uniref:Ribosomal RNA-processing protein 7 C-terminal domain-containing protein n=1 Tax=Tetranychus urticae TaxID=32264 RepID=T1L4V1_TETUR|nr:ribosomal RNA-processing protein 7 homolog A [Tetranychus urticae]